MPASDLTVREAAELAGVSKSVIEKALEANVLRARKAGTPLKGGGTRFLPMEAVVYFSALHRSGLSPSLSVAHKKKLWAAISKTRLDKLDAIEFAPGAMLDIRKLAAEPLEAARRYREARDEHIVIDENILGGTPVIRGTRITVYSILGRVQGRETIEDIAADNPDIERTAIEAALLYAKTHPLRGKPSGRPWRNAA